MSERANWSSPSPGEAAEVPAPDRTPAALRSAVARLDPGALSRFDDDWARAIGRAREEYSVTPLRRFVEHWWSWAAVARRPDLASRLHDCERIVAQSPDRAARRAAAAQIGSILAEASAQPT